MICSRIPDNNRHEILRGLRLKISVESFKGFAKPTSLELKRLNVLTGANSGGKSTWIQLLLLVKQSLEARSQVSPLKLNNPYVKLGRFSNLVNRKSTKLNEFSVEFEIPYTELTPRLCRELEFNENVRAVFGAAKRRNSRVSSKLLIGVTFSTDSKQHVVVKKFTLRSVENNKGDEVISCSLLELSRIRANQYRLFSQVPKASISTAYSELALPGDTGSFDSRVDINFLGFFPEWFTMQNDYYDFGVIVSQARLSLVRAFNKISYLGPLREEPREFYYQEDELVDDIGNKGENAAYIMALKAKEKVECPLLPCYDDGRLIVATEAMSFEEAVNYWLCDVFGLAEKIKSERSKTNSRIHTVKIQNKSGAIIPITHVGFGVSQVFPIIVEGLRAQPGSLIILEQPEIHLHPRVQSLLFDFSIALGSRRVRLMVETHSDHFINRLRRRVAEDDSNSIANGIGLMFVSTDEQGSSINELNLTDFGTLTRWPSGFFDQYDEDMRAIVKAQAAKRSRAVEV